VLGGSGFIGSHLVEALLLAGYRVRSFDTRPLPVEVRDVERIEAITGDFLDPRQVSDAVRDCDFVFHLVSTTLPKSSNDDPAADVRENLLPTLALLDAACEDGVTMVVFLS
jgi:UDP-glucose 4-epimerase